jgi:copper chaperone
MGRSSDKVYLSIVQKALDLDTMSSPMIRLSNKIGNFAMNQTFNVQGMTCGHCEKAVTTAIKTLDPQAQVSIDRAQNRVEVSTEKSREAVAAAIQEEGYEVAV